MENETYKTLKEELPSIAELVKQFPEALHERVFSVLIRNLLGHSSHLETDKEISNPVAADTYSNTSDSAGDETNLVEQFKNFLAKKGEVDKLNDMEFATLVTYFYAKVASKEYSLTEIDKDVLEDACVMAARKPSTDSSSTLKNAKHKKKYLDSGNLGGKYKLARMGQYFVEHELPKPG